MTRSDQLFIIFLLALSVVILVFPALFFGIRKWMTRKKKNKSGIGKMLVFSGCLLGSIWCLRYAVGYYTVQVAAAEGELMLTWWEEVFNSIAHALQTFSMDEDYTGYVIGGKQMLRDLLGESGTAWETAYGLYCSTLNFIAPVAGGAIIFEILASVFPAIKLKAGNFVFWREKCYFSELNEQSLALAKSLVRACKSRWARPIVIFTDAYVNDDDERQTEMLMEAKTIGAICVQDDLSHVSKSRFGSRKFFLIDEKQSGNLRALTNLATEENFNYLKKSEIYFFTTDDNYIQLERRVQEKLEAYGFSGEDLPIFVPVKNYRNLISNLLVDIPLYEPLIHKKRGEDGIVDLTVTIFGTGFIGTEMFLSTYWFGQILNCRLHINVISQESEDEFWGKIDSINPEIRQTTVPGHPCLRYNRKGEFSPVYADFRYLQCDVTSSEFVRHFTGDACDESLLNTDYFLVSLGADEMNLSVAETLRKYVGQHHLSCDPGQKAVIAYVVYDTELAATMNRNRKHSFSSEGADVYLTAIGSLDEVYSAENIFMTEHEPLAKKAFEYYRGDKNREKLVSTHRKRMRDDYKHWANLARAMHIKYKVFSLGFLSLSLFDVESPEDPRYRKHQEEALAAYRKKVRGEVEFRTPEELAQHMELLHHMAWLEHRRWNAFTRIKGFRYSDCYDAYAKPGVVGSYKHMDLRLHPCLVECDRKGIRGTIRPDGSLEAGSVFLCTDREDLDYLDELSYDLYEKKYNDYDFKQYDYPLTDF